MHQAVGTGIFVNVGNTLTFEAREVAERWCANCTGSTPRGCMKCQLRQLSISPHMHIRCAAHTQRYVARHAEDKLRTVVESFDSLPLYRAAQHDTEGSYDVRDGRCVSSVHAQVEIVAARASYEFTVRYSRIWQPCGRKLCS